MRRKIPEQELIKIIKSNVKPSLATLILAIKVQNITELKVECKGTEKLLRENRTKTRHINEVTLEDNSIHITRDEVFDPRNSKFNDAQ